jgi:hypothetical protein
MSTGPGADVQHASTVLMVDLLRGTRVYCDLFGEAPPILVIDTGSTEVQLTIGVGSITVDDLAVIDSFLEAAAAYRCALLAQLP